MPRTWAQGRALLPPENPLRPVPQFPLCLVTSIAQLFPRSEIAGDERRRGGGRGGRILHPPEGAESGRPGEPAAPRWDPGRSAPLPPPGEPAPRGRPGAPGPEGAGCGGAAGTVPPGPARTGGARKAALASAKAARSRLLAGPAQRRTRAGPGSSGSAKLASQEPAVASGAAALGWNFRGEALGRGRSRPRRAPAMGISSPDGFRR